MYERSIIKVKISLWNPNCISILCCWLSHFSVMCANLEVNIKPCKFDIKYITYLWYLSTLLNCHLIFYAIFNYHKCKAIKKVIKKCMFLCAIFKSSSSKICTGQMIILQMNSNKYNFDKTEDFQACSIQLMQYISLSEFAAIFSFLKLLKIFRHEVHKYNKTNCVQD